MLRPILHLNFKESSRIGSILLFHFLPFCSLKSLPTRPSSETILVNVINDAQVSPPPPQWSILNSHFTRIFSTDNSSPLLSLFFLYFFIFLFSISKILFSPICLLLPHAHSFTNTLLALFYLLDFCLSNSGLSLTKTTSLPLLLLYRWLDTSFKHLLEAIHFHFIPLLFP